VKRSSNGILVCPALAQKEATARKKSELRKSRESNNASSRLQREEYSGTSESIEERHCERKHNKRRAKQPIK
jgi:hypothetical protein